MAAFDFPATPYEGQQFVPMVGGPVYVWHSPVWQIAGGTGASTAFVGALPPPGPADGQIWWESDTGNSFVWYNDGNSSQWVQMNIQTTMPNIPAFLQRQVIKTSKTVTLHADTKSFLVEVQAGGGGGGGAAGTAGGTGSAGGGGGGGYCSRWFAKTAGQVLTATVGAGGAHGVGSSGAPGVGGSSVFTDGLGTTMTANGGSAGSNNTGGPIFSPSATANGGAATGGDLNVEGGPSAGGLGFGTSTTAGSNYMGGFSGGGGRSQLGNGGRPLYAYTNAGTGQVGSDGRGHGGGGGGGLAYGTGAVVDGGDGASGVIIITEFR